MLLREYSLEGKLAIVTGAGRGIGKAISLVFAEAGADIVAVARNVEQIEETVAEVRRLGSRAIAIPADVTKADQVERMVEKTISEFGKIDILVNNAGMIHLKQLVPIPDVKLSGWERVRDLDTAMSEEEWHRTMNTNLSSVFLCSRAVGPYMIKQRKGKVINISSRNAISGDPYRLHYNTSKAAVNMFTRCLAVEWAPFNINVNAIGPGAFQTTLSAELFKNEEIREQTLSPIPLKRAGELRELGLLALYLASDASNYMTGQIFYLDGGKSAL